MLSSGRSGKMCWRGWLVPALAAVTLALLPAAAGGATRHVVAVTRHPITGLAFDETRLAWSTRCGGLHSVSLTTGAQFAALRCPRSDHPRLLALGGRLAALFSVTGRTGRVVTTPVDQATEPVRRTLGFRLPGTGCPRPGWRVTGAAGDGEVLAWSLVRMRTAGSCSGPHRQVVADGVTYELLPEGDRISFGEVTYRLDAWDFRGNQLPERDRLAIVPAPEGVGLRPTVPVEVFGDLVDIPFATFSPVASVRAVAVFKTRVIVLVRSAGPVKRIAWYDRDTGAFVGSVAVPPDTAPSIDATASRVVYQVGNEIWTLRLSDGHTQRVFASHRTPRRVLIEGNVVAWYTTRGGSVVSTLTLGPA
jgi:hypothetical protein